MPECTVCGTELEFDNTCDQYSDADIVIFYEEGHCPKCGKKFKWRDEYHFETFTDLEEK
jgi:predicted RNA-binding Zn-ribbon protein involved in translation (DUF1610 family)